MQKQKDPHRCETRVQDAKQTGLCRRNPAGCGEDQQVSDGKLYSPEDREQGDILRLHNGKICKWQGKQAADKNSQRYGGQDIHGLVAPQHKHKRRIEKDADQRKQVPQKPPRPRPGEHHHGNADEAGHGSQKGGAVHPFAQNQPGPQRRNKGGGGEDHEEVCDTGQAERQDVEDHAHRVQGNKHQPPNANTRKGAQRPPAVADRKHHKQKGEGSKTTTGGCGESVCRQQPGEQARGRIHSRSGKQKQKAGLCKGQAAHEGGSVAANRQGRCCISYGAGSGNAPKVLPTVTGLAAGISPARGKSRRCFAPGCPKFRRLPSDRPLPHGQPPWRCRNVPEGRVCAWPRPRECHPAASR